MTTTHKHCTTVIQLSLANVQSKKFQNNPWGLRHYQAWTCTPKPSIVMMIESCAMYADRHFEQFGSLVGEDYVLGEAWKDMMLAIRVMLNGELGNLDGGTLDALILDMLKSQGFETDLL